MTVMREDVEVYT